MQNIVLCKLPNKAILQEIRVECLSPGKYQPRQEFQQEGLESLANTIKQLGVLQPIVVRKIPLTDNRYEIVAGERRWRAAQLASLSTLPCLVSDYTEEQSAQIALVENMCREDLSPLVEAKAIDRLIQEFDYTHEEVGAVLGITRSMVTNLLRLLKLDARLQKWLTDGDLSEAHGKILAGVALDEQYRLGYEALRRGLSARGLQHEIETQKIKKKNPAYSQWRKDIYTVRIEQQLSDKLGSPVILTQKKDGTCTLSINFVKLDQMQDVLEKLGYEPE